MSKVHYYETTKARRNRIDKRTGVRCSRAHAQRMCGVLRGPYTTIRKGVTCEACLRLLKEDDEGVVNYKEGE